MLRSLGLTGWETIRVYIYESLALVYSCIILGTITGRHVSRPTPPPSRSYLTCSYPPFSPTPPPPSNPAMGIPRASVDLFAQPPASWSTARAYISLPPSPASLAFVVRRQNLRESS